MNIAAKMESTGQPLRVQISQSTRALLHHFAVEERTDLIAIKGKGDFKTYWLNGAVGL